MGFDLARLAGTIARNISNKNQEKQWSPELLRKMQNLEEKAEAGDVYSMVVLANKYYSSDEVKYDPHKACYWWEKAAENGHVQSQYNIGLIHLGDIVYDIWDDNIAGYWLEIAAENGHEEAYEVLTRALKYNSKKDKWYRIDGR